MEKLTEDQVRIIEDWVNDPEAIALVDLDKGRERYKNDQGELNVNAWHRWVADRWVAWIDGLEKKLGFSLDPEFADELIDDIADWEHDGNLQVYPADDDSSSGFGFGRWRMELMGQ